MVQYHLFSNRVVCMMLSKFCNVTVFSCGYKCFFQCFNGPDLISDGDSISVVPMSRFVRCVPHSHFEHIQGILLNSVVVNLISIMFSVRNWNDGYRHTDGRVGSFNTLQFGNHMNVCGIVHSQARGF